MYCPIAEKTARRFREPLAAGYAGVPCGGETEPSGDPLEMALTVVFVLLLGDPDLEAVPQPLTGDFKR